MIGVKNVSYLIGLIPALGWGVQPLILKKIKGNPANEILGTGIGALIIGLISLMFTTDTISTKTFIISFVSGLFWAIGQGNQLIAVNNIGVSKAMPISTGLQLVGTALFGVIVFHEWKTTTAIILGVIAIACILVGIIFTSKDDHDEEGKANFKKGMITLLISTAGFIGYAVIARFFEVTSWELVLPQAIGMGVGALALTMRHNPFNKYALLNIIPGLVWAAGNLFLFISQPKVGVAISFSLSQCGVIISTLGGIFLLGEKKTKKQLIYIAIGILLIIAGVAMLGITKNN